MSLDTWETEETGITEDKAEALINLREQWSQLQD